MPGTITAKTKREGQRKAKRQTAIAGTQNKKGEN
jgi:hypothetical protein